MSHLEKLIADQVAALAAWDACPDNLWDSSASHPINKAIRTARTAFLDHRPASMEEARRKADFMASCRVFCDWDDVDRVRLIEALRPAPEVSASEQPTLDDIASDARHLYDLLDVICDELFGALDDRRSARADSLLWIARDHSEKMLSDLTDFDQTKGGV